MNTITEGAMETPNRIHNSKPSKIKVVTKLIPIPITKNITNSDAERSSVTCFCLTSI